jgi:hypothetical protein
MKMHMRAVVLAAVALLMLSACGQSDEEKAKAAAEAAAAEAAKPVPLPTDPTNKSAWQQYLVKIVMRNMQGVKTNHPFMYYVPGGDGADQVSSRGDQLDNVTTTVLRGVLPGNMMAFGGPDSKLTADLIVGAFKDAGAGTLKGVVVLFIGAPADSDRVKAAIANSGAEFRFVEMK